MKVHEVVHKAINDHKFANNLRKLVDRSLKDGINSKAHKDFVSLFVEPGDEEGLNALLASPAFNGGFDPDSTSCWRVAILSTPHCTAATTTTTTATAHPPKPKRRQRRPKR